MVGGFRVVISRGLCSQLDRCCSGVCARVLLLLFLGRFRAYVCTKEMFVGTSNQHPAKSTSARTTLARTKGIHSVANLLWHLPTGMIDRRQVSRVAGLVEGEIATVLLKVGRSFSIFSCDIHTYLYSHVLDLSQPVLLKVAATHSPVHLHRCSCDGPPKAAGSTAKFDRLLLICETFLCRRMRRKWTSLLDWPIALPLLPCVSRSNRGLFPRSSSSAVPTRGTYRCAYVFHASRSTCFGRGPSVAVLFRCRLEPLRYLRCRAALCKTLAPGLPR